MVLLAWRRVAMSFTATSPRPSAKQIRERFRNHSWMLRRAFEAAADSTSDVVGMADWWSNCTQLQCQES